MFVKQYAAIINPSFITDLVWRDMVLKESPLQVGYLEEEENRVPDLWLFNGVLSSMWNLSLILLDMPLRGIFKGAHLVDID